MKAVRNIGIGMVIGLIVIWAVRSGDDQSSRQQSTTASGYMAEIEPAFEIQKEYVGEFLEPGLGLDGGYTIRSRSHQLACYVAARITGLGIGDDATGVWLLSGGKNDPGLVMSANLTAEEFSDAPRSKDSKAGGTFTDPEASALLKYTREYHGLRS
ncbi:MAG: hypothetical protein KJO98_04790 [Rhodothermia bacterium]|nr:hypothetical protein [Rhodothermia bacterium]